MNETIPVSQSLAILCVDDEAQVRDALVRDLERIVRSRITIEACSDAAEALDRLAELTANAISVPVIITDHIMPGTSGVDLLIALAGQPPYDSTRKVILSARTSVDDVSRALNRGALDRHLSKPWDYTDLEASVRELLTAYLAEHAPRELERFDALLNVGTLSTALASAQSSRRELDSQVSALKRSFLADIHLTDQQVEQAMIAGFDRALNNPAREKHPAGTVLLKEGEPVDLVRIIDTGQVQLSRRASEREIPFHHHTAGRIVGLQSLAHRQRAGFTVRALTDVTAIPLTLDQLEQALERDAELSTHFVTALIRAQATRNRRVAELQVENETLTATVSAERDQLANTLEQLRKTQMQLVETEKMATLGQLSAGIAHELNNPVAAIERAVDFVGEDVVRLLSDVPDGEIVQAVMLSAMESDPLSTREMRARTRDLAEVVNDENLARRLVGIGILDRREYERRFAGLTPPKRERRLRLMERYHQLGRSLRNISACADRIARLVESLRGYARNDKALIDDVNVHRGIEDTLALFGHALRDVEVERDYGDLPLVQCYPGQVNQVWTNLISNAIEAMNGKGKLVIQTDAPGPNRVHVRITDTGPGVPPELVDRVFDLNFTTKSGLGQFGLGMGLAICRQIIRRHNGTITMDSKPGRTCVTVTLPVRVAPEDDRPGGVTEESPT